MKKKVFISYSHRDKETAKVLAEILDRQGFSLFLDFQDLEAGEEWSERLKSELKGTSIFVPLISSDYIGSSYSMQEFGAAIATGKKIIPILLSPTTLPFNISKYQIIDRTKMGEREMNEKLLKAIA